VLGHARGEQGTERGHRERGERLAGRCERECECGGEQQDGHIGRTAMIHAEQAKPLT